MICTLSIADDGNAFLASRTDDQTANFRGFDDGRVQIICFKQRLDLIFIADHIIKVMFDQLQGICAVTFNTKRIRNGNACFSTSAAAGFCK